MDAGLSRPGRAAQSGGADASAHADAPLCPGGCAVRECPHPTPSPGMAETVQAHAEAMLALATEHGFARNVALGVLFRGMALAAQGQRAEGLGQMQQGLAAYRATGSAVGMSGHLAHLAEAYMQVDRVD